MCVYICLYRSRSRSRLAFRKSHLIIITILNCGPREVNTQVSHSVGGTNDMREEPGRPLARHNFHINWQYSTCLRL